MRNITRTIFLPFNGQIQNIALAKNEYFLEFIIKIVFCVLTVSQKSDANCIFISAILSDINI